jgi:regulatory protein YycI of two-component signal transduction system YycFG
MKSKTIWIIAAVLIVIYLIYYFLNSTGKLHNMTVINGNTGKISKM